MLKMVYVSIVDNRIVVADSSTVAENQLHTLIADKIRDIVTESYYGESKKQFKIRTAHVDVQV